MADYSDLDPTTLRRSVSDGTRLKKSITTDLYTGGTPTAANQVKPSIMYPSGTLKESVANAAGLKPSWLVAGGGGAWSPSDLGADLFAWYDASDADTITHSANAVSQWDDKSGNGRDIVQATGIYQPTWDGSSEIAFDGDDFLHLNSAYMYANGSIEIFFVGVGTAAGGNPVIIAEGNSTNNNPIYEAIITRDLADEWEVWLRNNAGSSRIFFSDIYSATGLFDGVTRRLLNFRDDGSNVIGYLNSTAGTNVAYTRSDPTDLDRWAIGGLLRSGTSVTQGATCDANEVIVTNSLASDERALLVAYLESKWSV